MNEEEEFLKKLRERERLKRVQFVKHKLFQPDRRTAVAPRRPMINIRVDDMDFFPRCHTDGSVGYDLYTTKTIVIPAGETVLVPTGVFLQLPVNMEAQVRPRSSTLIKGLLVGFGTIDSDFRGEIHVIVRNLNSAPFTVNYRDRLAQLCFANVVRPILNRVESLNNTERGSGAFGSTGE